MPFFSFPGAGSLNKAAQGPLLCFGLRVLGSGLRVLGFGFRVLSVKHRPPGHEIRRLSIADAV